MFEEATLAPMPPDLPEFYAVLRTDAPTRLETLPDGREALLSGDPETWLPFCLPVPTTLSESLALCRRLLRRFGLEGDEETLAGAVGAANRSESRAGAGTAGLSLYELASLLTEAGLPAHVERGYSVEDLGHALESGAGVLAVVNAGDLWDDPAAYGSGETNTAVLPAAVARDPLGGEVLGVFVSGASEGEWSRLVPAESLRAAWVETGGWYLVTDLVQA